jgi:hypothetical protein
MTAHRRTKSEGLLRAALMAAAGKVRDALPPDLIAVVIVTDASGAYLGVAMNADLGQGTRLQREALKHTASGVFLVPDGPRTAGAAAAKAAVDAALAPDLRCVVLTIDKPVDGQMSGYRTPNVDADYAVAMQRCALVGSKLEWAADDEHYDFSRRAIPKATR